MPITNRAFYHSRGITEGAGFSEVIRAGTAPSRTLNSLQFPWFFIGECVTDAVLGHASEQIDVVVVTNITAVNGMLQYTTPRHLEIQQHFTSKGFTFRDLSEYSLEFTPTPPPSTEEPDGYEDHPDAEGDPPSPYSALYEMTHPSGSVMLHLMEAGNYFEYSALSPYVHNNTSIGFVADAIAKHRVNVSRLSIDKFAVIPQHSGRLIRGTPDAWNSLVTGNIVEYTYSDLNSFVPLTTVQRKLDRLIGSYHTQQPVYGTTYLHEEGAQRNNLPTLNWYLPDASLDHKLITRGLAHSILIEDASGSQEHLISESSPVEVYNSEHMYGLDEGEEDDEGSATQQEEDSTGSTQSVSTSGVSNWRALIQGSASGNGARWRITGRSISVREDSSSGSSRCSSSEAFASVWDDFE